MSERQSMYVKKVGDPRPETIKVELTSAERDEQRRLACDLRDQQAKLKEEKANSMAAFRARHKDLEAKEEAARNRASTGVDHAVVLVQDYLTRSNEVVSLRVDTNEQVVRRTATADELQEDLFGGGQDDGGSAH